jgi:RNA polymerase sigma factor (sigma-70 family)
VSSDRQEQVESLYRTQGVRVLGYLLRRVQEPDDAADLLSEVLVTAWRRRDALPQPPDDILWLFGVARNVLANDRRASRRRDTATRALADVLRTKVVQDDADIAEALDVRAALARLPEQEREIVQLTAWEGLTSDEVGRLLGIPAATVRSRLTRARSRLRHDLGHGTTGRPIATGREASRSAGRPSLAGDSLP